MSQAGFSVQGTPMRLWGTPGVFLGNSCNIFQLFYTPEAVLEHFIRILRPQYIYLFLFELLECLDKTLVPPLPPDMNDKKTTSNSYG